MPGLQEDLLELQNMLYDIDKYENYDAGWAMFDAYLDGVIEYNVAADEYYKFMEVFEAFGYTLDEGD